MLNVLLEKPMKEMS